jgi:hypothetical protein
MQLYYKAYQIYKGSYSMGQHLVMWMDIILIKTKVHLRYKNMALKVTTREEAPQRRNIMEARCMLTSRTHLKNPLVSEHITPRNFLVVKPVHPFRGEERGERVLRFMTLKSLRKIIHPLLIDRLRRRKKQDLGYLA